MGTKRHEKLLIFWVGMFISIIITAVGCQKTLKNKNYINYISFSHDGNKILFDRRKSEEPYMINVYDLKTGELSAYQSPPEEIWTMARYSYDGKYIVFSIIPVRENHMKLDEMQLAIMEPDGKNIRRITSTEGCKIYPSFSHSGDKIIFAKAGALLKRGPTPAADYDIYEVDISTCKESRLTWFKFFIIFPPYLFPDDETIIFGAYDPTENKQCKNTTREYIYIMKKGQSNLPEPFICHEQGNRGALVSKDGKHIYFEELAQNPDGIHGEGEQYYEYATDGKHRQITHMTRFTSTESAALSPDGQYLAIVTDIEGSKRIVICRIQDGTSETINLPDRPSHIINKQTIKKAEQGAPPDAAEPRR